ncbi:DNA binding protein [Rhynchospora pubera]|uniref:DNA binding protein n=1 Tax=Rhynchospora pubera TaxID=906938 RepID=A0AAV8G3S0_9POAL|nr:DNA binding protein [Rhynchospora pubera]
MQRLSGFSVSRARDVKNTLLFNSFHTQHTFSTAAAESTQESSVGRKFASYTLFKGKAALQAYPILPKFCTTSSGFSRMEKNGVVMLVFWPAIGTRKYDWEKKQYFALSPTEVGSLVSLGPSDSCEFFHDPSMKSSAEGQIKKSLTIAPANGQSGYFANLSVMNNLTKTNERLTVAITKAEFAVLRTACSYVLPHIMGWDQVIGQEKQTQPKPVVDRPHPEFEWSR